MKTLKEPRTNKQEILFHLIEYGHVSIMDYPYMSGFRTRISELCNDNGLMLSIEIQHGKNKFNNPFIYHLHKLEDMDMAVKIYEEITK